jgi:hypothetical protein
MKADDIRPKELFAKYMELVTLDAEKLRDKAHVRIPCPACDSSESERRFEKFGYAYRLCLSCGSLFCSPRPSADDLRSMYIDSPSAEFWQSEFMPAVAESRREKIFRPRAREILNLLEHIDIYPSSICDVGAGHGLLLDEFRRLSPESECTAIEPSTQCARICANRGFQVICKTLEDSVNEINQPFTLVVSSEVIEHSFSPYQFVKSLVELTEDKGCVLITGLGYEGLDILTLQGSSESIFPPQHINFLSVVGFKRLLERCGLSQVEVITPGKLDVELVLKSKPIPEFFRVLTKRPGAADELQNFLQKHSLSSHVWAYGRKP